MIKFRSNKVHKSRRKLLCMEYEPERLGRKGIRFQKGSKYLEISSKEMKIRKYILLMIYTGSLI